MKHEILVFAHRGASGYMFENSMEAYELARKLGADGLEIDIQTTRDGELIVIHDMNLKRLTGVNRLIQECSIEEVSRLSIGKPLWRRLCRKKIPMFEQVVKWANTHHMLLNIELKESLLLNSTPLERVLPYLQLPEGSHFSSFHDELLRIVKALRPDIETALIITKKFNFDKLGEYPHIDSIHANKKRYNRRLLQACAFHHKGVRFYAIEGDEPFLHDPHPQVIGWITDYPDKIIRIQKA